MESGIGHHINNPLSPVALYTSLLLDKEPGLSPRTRQYLETTQRAIEDVAQTVGRMREFYRPREHQLALEPVRVNDLVRQVVDLTPGRAVHVAEVRGILIQTRTWRVANP